LQVKRDDLFDAVQYLSDADRFAIKIDILNFNYCGKDFSDYENAELTLLNFVLSSRHKKEGKKNVNIEEYLNKTSQAKDMAYAEIKMRRGHKEINCVASYLLFSGSVGIESGGSHHNINTH